MFVDKDGYLRVTQGDRQILIHRFIMEKYLGRPLTKQEDVHHRNGDRQDNRLQNLELLSHGKHSTITHTKDKSDRLCYQCRKKTRLNPNTGGEMWYTGKAKKWMCDTCYKREYRSRFK